MRYTGTYYEDGHTDCSASLGLTCQYEHDTTCFHCDTPVREHLDEDGTPRLVERRSVPPHSTEEPEPHR